jgi:hypothetical protein
MIIIIIELNYIFLRAKNSPEANYKASTSREEKTNKIQHPGDNNLNNNNNNTNNNNNNNNETECPKSDHDPSPSNIRTCLITIRDQLPISFKAKLSIVLHLDQICQLTSESIFIYKKSYRTRIRSSCEISDRPESYFANKL